MSEILSEGKEEIYRTKRKLTGIKCDNCENVVPAGKYNTDENEFYRVTTGHREWGNDSIDSISYYDICPCCIKRFVMDYLKDSEYD